MQNQRGFGHFLEGCAEGFNQGGGEAPDEPHGIAQQHAAVRGKHRAAYGRIESSERARATNPVEFPLDILDARGNATAIRLQFGLAWPTPGSDAAAHPRHLDAMASQA